MIAPFIPLIISVIDKIFPDPEDAAKHTSKVLKMKADGELKGLEASMSAILAEANSKHTMVALARPMFMYIFYFLVVMLVVIFPIVGIFKPEAMALFYGNVGLGFAAIPDAMWTTFTVGYLGYAGARSYDKKIGKAS